MFDYNSLIVLRIVADSADQAADYAENFLESFDEFHAPTGLTYHTYNAKEVGENMYEHVMYLSWPKCKVNSHELGLMLADTQSMYDDEFVTVERVGRVEGWKRM